MNPYHDKLGRFSSKNTVFISGSSKTQTKGNPYYRKLPKPIKKEIKNSIKAKDKIIVGDAPGIDRQVQDYLNRKRYKNVEIYGPGTELRYKKNKKWKGITVNSNFEKGSKEWLAEKDIAMAKASTKGIAIILDEGSKATKRNIKRMTKQGKPMSIYELNKDGKVNDGYKSIQDLFKDPEFKKLKI